MKEIQLLRCESIILQAFDYQEYDKILCIFSRTRGLLNLIAKGANRPGKKGSAQASPLTHAEIVYTETRGDLFKCKEITPIRMFLHLRENYELLKAACDAVNTIRASQLPQKPAPQLFDLLLYILNKLPEVKDPHTLTACLRMKILKHEGLINIDNRCIHCHELLTKQYCHRGSSYCRQHAPPLSLSFDEEETLLITFLAYGQSFSHLRELIIPEKTLKKYNLLFKETVGINSIA